MSEPGLTIPAAPPPRRRLRFSLRTLLLATLFIASAATLWMHWEPWALERTLIFQDNERAFESVISPDGRRVLTIHDHNCAIIRDIFTGEQQTKLLASWEGFNHAAFAPDGRRVVCTSQDGTARVYDAHSGEQLAIFEDHRDRVYGISFSRDGKQVLTCSGDGTARIWDPETARQIREFKGHEGGVLSTTWTPDGLRVITAALDGTVREWDAASGKQLRNLGTDMGFGGLQFSPDGQHVLVLYQNMEVVLRDAATFKPVSTWEMPFIVYRAQFFRDGRRLLSSGANLKNDTSQSVILDMRDGKVLITFPCTARPALAPDQSRLIAIYGSRLHFWSYRRPEYAWGILALPELWLTLVLSVALVLSLVRDRKSHRLHLPPPLE